MSNIEKLEWAIQGLQVESKNGVDDVIVSAFVNINGIIGANSASVLCQQDIPFETSNFVPFAQVKEDDVISWIQNAMGQERIERMKSNIENQINETIANQKPSLAFRSVPWATN
jgi:hypothetical protein